MVLQQALNQAKREEPPPGISAVSRGIRASSAGAESLLQVLERR